ncbi:MAG: hypothetical protein IJ220_07800 [Clostridia bacterium]|nr:hypothetical protein [Clostridia bacterium]
MDEENKNNQNPDSVEDENKNIEGTGDVGTQANENKDEGDAEKKGKTYTQDEVNSLLKKEKEKYQKKMPSKERLEALEKYEESQKSAEQKQAEKETKYQKALSDLQEKENYIAVLESGVSKEDSDYVLFKVSKMEGDFNENLEEFLKSNPKYTNTKKETDEPETKTDGVSVKNMNNKKDSGVTAILKQKHPDLFK